MRLIDADALIEEHCDGCEYYDSHFCTPDDPVCGAVEVMNDAPTIDAVEVVHGRWVVEHKESVRCSECCFNRASIKIPMDYCPNCGAKMDGERRADDKRTDSTDPA